MFVERIERLGLGIGLSLQLVDHREHRLPAIDARKTDAARGRDVPHGELGGVRVGQHFERAVLEAQDSGHPAAKLAADIATHLHERRQGRLEPVLMADHRPDTGVVRSGIEVSARHAPLVGQLMAAVLGVPAPQDGEAIQFPGEVRTDFRELDAWHGRVDQRIGTADVFGSKWFGVERVVMAGTAERPDEDAVHVLAGPSRPSGGRVGFGAVRQHHRQRNAQSAQRAHLQQRPTAQASTGAHHRGRQVEHGGTPTGETA